LFATLGELRRTRYDAVIDLQGLLKSALLSRLVGTRRTIGFPRGHLREPLARVFYTEAPDPGGAAHVIRKNLALLRPLDVETTRILFPIAIPHTATVTAIAERFGSTGYAVLNPGAAWPNKRWPPDRFGALAARVHRELGVRSVVLWGPGEQPIASAVAAQSDGAAEPAPPTSVPDVIGIARAARLMVSGDTGPLHLAGAVGTPLVALFGPTYHERNGPWDERDITISRARQCVCHYERRCRRTDPCINDISVDDVMAAVRQRLSVRA
jgi:ADP-heptose:LPS heptosyltransferase